MTEDQHTQQDPTQQYPQPEYPEQDQRDQHPGLEQEMQPEPDYGYETARPDRLTSSSGRLARKCRVDHPYGSRPEVSAMAEKG
jgi:hypothetical protein